MNAIAEYQRISPTTLADILGREQVMEGRIRPLWSPMPRVAGPAFTVRCPPGDNVCAVAQRRGIAAFVVDGVIRDIAEVRDMGFPVFARG
jgi:4-hydroxy-4-methyl-2-oxoglutarate aldolase